MEKRLIYADNAATTKLSLGAFQEMTKYLKEEYGNPSSLYSLGQKAKEGLEDARIRIARAINAEPREIYFTSGGSEADNQAILSMAYAGEKKGKKHIISTPFEHHAVLNTLAKLKKQGFEITFLPVHENGIVRPQELDSVIREDTALVTIMYANNEIGTIQPISELGSICAKKGVPFHTDAVQAVGHLPIDVKKENISLLSFSSHKFHGPKGVGVLYCKKGLILSNLIEGGQQEFGKRGGTENVAGIVGTAKALEESLQNRDEKNKNLIILRNELISGLCNITHSRLNGDKEQRLPSNVNMSFEGIEGESLILLLDDEGIMASSGSACASGSLEASHVLLSIGVPREVAHGSLRLSLDDNVTEEDIKYIIEKVKEVVTKLRDFSPVWKDLQEGNAKYVIQ